MKKARNSFGDPYPCKQDWPDDCSVQCGGNGLVMASGSMEETLASEDPIGEVAKNMSHKDSYVTAFFEAFPNDPSCFIRGEGKTIEDAEKSAWDKYQGILSCNHEMERRGREDGYGYCKNCAYSAMVFKPLTKCCKCGVPTRQSVDHKGKWYCVKHCKTKPKDPDRRRGRLFGGEPRRLPRKKKKLIKKCAEAVFRFEGIHGKVKIKVGLCPKVVCGNKLITLLFRTEQRTLIEKGTILMNYYKTKDRS